MFRTKAIVVVLMLSLSLTLFPNILKAERVSGSTSSSSSSVSAITNKRMEELRKNMDKRLTAAEREAKIAELRNADSTERCAMVRNNIEARSRLYAESDRKYSNRYSELVRKLESVIASQTALGKDVTALTNNLEQLLNYIQEVKTLQETLQAKWLEAAELSCTDQEALKTKIEEIQAVLKEIRDLHIEIQRFINEEVKTNLTALKPSSSRTTSKSSSSRATSSRTATTN